MTAGDTAAILSSAAALGTAGVTLWLTVLTRAAARASERAADLAGRQLQEAHRPVLVPTAAEGLRPDGHASPKVTLHNIGAGPALRVSATAHLTRPRKADERDQPAPTRTVHADWVLPGIAAGGADVFSFRRDAIEVERGRIYKVDISFDDVAGRHYSVMTSWDGRLGAFGHVEVTERPGLRLERIPPRGSRLAPWRRGL